MIYEYQETRQAEHPREFLQGYAGYLHTDRYAGYHAMPPEITVVGCWAHARRKFDEALNVITPNDQASFKAMQEKRFCDALFSAEDKLNHLAPQERAEKRQELAEPILAEFRTWLASRAQVGHGQSRRLRAGAIALSDPLSAGRPPGDFPTIVPNEALSPS